MLKIRDFFSIVSMVVMYDFLGICLPNIKKIVQISIRCKLLHIDRNDPVVRVYNMRMPLICT